MTIFAKLARLLAVLPWAATPAFAQAPEPRPIAVAADQPFAHAGSGVTLPARLDGMARTQIREYEAPQVDIVATYAAPGGAAELSVYVYHVLSGSVPVWFDRAAWAVEDRPTFGTPIRIDRPLAFAPAGRTTPDAMIAAWNLSGSGYRGTALALVPVGDWLVKLRYTAKGLDAATLHDRLVRAVGDLALPAGTAPAAVPVAACTTPLATRAQAKPAAGGNTDMLANALLASTAASGVEPTAATAGAWCRDATRLPMGGVYRTDATPNAYLVAMSDAGRGIWVARDRGAALTGAKDARWAISVMVPGRTLTFASRDRLLPPDEALAVLREAPLSVVQTVGRKRSVTINRDAM